MLECLPIDLLRSLVEMSDWPLESYCRFVAVSHTLRTKIRGTLHTMDFECPRDDLNDDDSTPDCQRYAPVLRPATLVALLAPCQNTLRSLALPSGRSLTGCGREEASFAGWVDAAFGGGLGGTLRSLTIRSLEGLSLGTLHRMLGHLSALEHFSVTFHPPDEGAPGAVLAMLCPACPHLRSIHFGAEQPVNEKELPYLRESFSCDPLAGCPELVELDLGDAPADVASLNGVLPRLPRLQLLKAAHVSGHPTHLDLSQLAHPDQLRALRHPCDTAHFDLLTGLEELAGSLSDRLFAELAPHLRRVAIFRYWGASPVAMPRLVEYEGQSGSCPPDAWTTLERATLFGTAEAQLRLVAPRLRHLAVLRGPGPDTACLKRLEAPLLESLEYVVWIDGQIEDVEVHCPLLRSLTLRAFTGRLPLIDYFTSSSCVFPDLRTLIIEGSTNSEYQNSDFPAVFRAAIALAPNLTTLKGIALTDPDHLSILADLCSGALLPHLTHLDATASTRPKGLRLRCSPILRVLTLRLYQPLPRHILRIEGPALVRLQVEATRMPPLVIEAPRLRACRLEARSYQPTVRLAAPALRRLSFECHNDNLSALPAALAGLQALDQLRLVVPWLPSGVVTQILATAPGHPLIDLTLLVRGPAKTAPLEVALPPWVRSLAVMERAVEVRLQGGAGLESIDVARVTKLTIPPEDGPATTHHPNLVRATGHGPTYGGGPPAFPPPAGLPTTGCRVATRFWRV
ncbi:hypothetical protein PAPYR_1651 [Paratrimastix pyriformis]|uniref:F-box domain-containing protein n=1 Tax=Paratrimastix pyriformis TaxID=342808 RepID=A0ABQ8US45_9EUKA|nr:hypothetical protein PAPYR_1651 [Paratrimastix pyriformis]